MPKFLVLLIICGAFLSASGQTFDGPAELPRTTMEVRESFTVSQNIPIYVSSTISSLQAVLNSARPGDVIVIDAAFTATLSGLVLPNGTADAWITIKSSAEPLLPSEQNRISPAFAGITSLPGRPAYVQPTGGAARLMPQIILKNQNASTTGGSYVRLIGLEITRPIGTGRVTSLFSALGHDIIIDRCWLHGTPIDETVRGINVTNGSNIAIINSYFNDFHCRARSGTCTDSQAILGGLDSVQSGNYLIQNNYLESGTETILFGGGVSSTTPNDISILFNDSFKPMMWNPLDPTYDGGTASADGIKHPWIVKNHYELKNANRVLFEGNRLQNNWGGFSQAGAMVLFTAKNQSGPPNAFVTNITYRNNYASYGAQAFQIACAVGVGWPVSCSGYSIHDNVFDHLQYSTCYLCTSYLNEILSSYATAPDQPQTAVLHDISIVQNTFENDGWLSPPSDPAASTVTVAVLMGAIPVGGTVPQNTNMHFDNNVFDPGNNGIYSSGGGVNNCFSSQPWNIKRLIFVCWPGGSFTGNQLITTVPFVASRLPWSDGNGPANPLAGANMTTLNTALANRR